MPHAVDPERLTVEVHGPVTVVRLTHGENRLHPDLLDALEATIDQVELADGAGALVLTGAGKFFSNGLDLDYMSMHPARAEATLTSVHALLGRILGLGIPTVAAINGHAFAAGAMLALTFDEAVMRSDRGFFCLPEADLGLSFTPAMTALITSRLSPPVAHQAMVSAKRLHRQRGARCRDRHASRGERRRARPSDRSRRSAGRKARQVIAAIKRGLYGDPLDLPLRATHD